MPDNTNSAVFSNIVQRALDPLSRNRLLRQNSTHWSVFICLHLHTHGQTKESIPVQTSLCRNTPFSRRLDLFHKSILNGVSESVRTVRESHKFCLDLICRLTFSQGKMGPCMDQNREIGREQNIESREQND